MSPARLFVAAWLPGEVLDRLEALERPVVEGVRWTVRAQWHVTLRFLGSVDDPAEAVTALRALQAESATATLGPRVGRLGRGVLMVPVQGLDALAGAVRDATAAVGEPPDPRPFLGHVTLARLRGAPACGLVREAVRARFEVREVALVRSHLDPSGARYETVATVPLGACPNTGS